MILLALEASSERRSVAVARDGRVLAQASHAAGRGTPLFALIRQVLDQAEVAREAVETVAVGLGPGSYTGIRTTIAAAQGWELALGTRLLGLSSVEACAVRCRREGLRGRVAIVVDAQRGEFYTADYELTDAAVRSLTPLRLVARAALDPLLAGGAQLAGPDTTRAGLRGREVMPDAAALIELAAASTDFVTGESLAPVYLRATNFAKAPPARQVG